MISKMIFLIAVLISCVASQPWNSLYWCPKYSGKTFSATSQNAKGLNSIILKFRAALGGVDNINKEGPLGSGHRSINWDADAVPFNMPGDFFKNTVTRGAEFFAVEGKFAVSNPPSQNNWFGSHVPAADNEFSSFNSIFPKLFTTFSPKRLFTPVKSNNVITVFSIPGKHHGQEAFVSGFGAVFTNVGLKGKTFLNYYDENDCLILRQPVLLKPKGLSFAGILVVFKNKKKVAAAIASVKITLGNGIVSRFRKGKNFVVLDDLIYGEPQLVHNR